MKLNLVPNSINQSPDYYCTWQTQLYYTSNEGPIGQRRCMTEENIFGNGLWQGWANFYEKARKDLYFVMDDSWDVPLNDDSTYYGSLILNREKFRNCCSAKTPNEALNKLSQRIKALGWKGVGGWVCAQESVKLFNGINRENYWIERLIWAKESGFSYWKVDWGKYGMDFEFRKMLTNLGHQYAPNLYIEHATIQEIIGNCDIYRTYDVPAIMSIPMTMEKLKDALMHNCNEGYLGFINCEDEVYIAAALGCTMGIMRHEIVGNLPNGSYDLSFPALHRNLKTKQTEIIRAVRWHRIAPSFGVDAGNTYISNQILKDYWNIKNQSEEIEAWWNFKDGDTIEKSAPSAISRNIKLPSISGNSTGITPYVVASKNPNGAISIATLGRTINREYIVEKCDVEIEIEDSSIIGVFGYYKNLILHTGMNTKHLKIFAQDLADDEAMEITEMVIIKNNKIIISGNIISEIGKKMNLKGDTSEPGLIIEIISNFM